MKQSFDRVEEKNNPYVDGVQKRQPESQFVLFVEEKWYTSALHR